MTKNMSLCFLAVLIPLLCFIPKPSVSKNSVSSYRDKQAVMVPPAECIDAYLDNIAGDTYAAKFKNSCDDDYRVYYKIIDGDKTVQDTTSIVVKAHSSNSSGTYHCSPEAKIKIIKKEAIK